VRSSERHIKLELDGWIISRWGGGTLHFIYHNCNDCDEPSAVVYSRMLTLAGLREPLADVPTWRCSRCWREACDDIVGAYILLESDYASDLIERVAKSGI
jgi:hypothetical protein